MGQILARHSRREVNLSKLMSLPSGKQMQELGGRSNHIHIRSFNASAHLYIDF